MKEAMRHWSKLGPKGWTRFLTSASWTGGNCWWKDQTEGKPRWGRRYVLVIREALWGGPYAWLQHNGTGGQGEGGERRQQKTRVDNKVDGQGYRLLDVLIHTTCYISHMCYMSPITYMSRIIYILRHVEVSLTGTWAKTQFSANPLSVSKQL